jgi:hypothetical protein
MLKLLFNQIVIALVHIIVPLHKRLLTAIVSAGYVHVQIVGNVGNI